MLRQSAGMAVQKSINRWPHHAFEPFFKGFTYFGVWCGWRFIAIIAVLLSFKSHRN